MTDDIVTRLRTYHPATCAGCDIWGNCGYGIPCGCDCHQSPHHDAADEIERLREKVQDLRMHAEQDACEIERLRATIAGWSQDISNLEDQVEDCENDFHALKQMFDRTREQASLAHSILSSESMGWLAGGGSNHEASHWEVLMPHVREYWNRYGSFFRKAAND